MNDARKHSGFTIVEALVAGVILAMAVVTLTSISTRCLARIRLNQQYELAWQALDRQLTTIDVMGIDQFILQGETSGVVEDEQAEEGDTQYYWEVTTQDEELDSLYRVTISIRWTADNRQRKITAETLLNGESAILTMPTELQGNEPGNEQGNGQGNGQGNIR